MQTGKFIRILSVVLLVALLGFILASRNWVEKTRKPSGDRTAPAGVAALDPEKKVRLFSGYCSGCLLVVTRLEFLDLQQKAFQDWLTRALGESARRTTFLYFHFFVPEQGSTFAFDPSRDQVALTLENGTVVRNRDLNELIREKRLSPQDRLIFSTEVPARTIQPGPLAVGKVLMAFPGSGLWTEVEAVRLVQGDETSVLEAREIPFVDWENLVSGGPVPEVLGAGPAQPR